MTICSAGFIIADNPHDRVNLRFDLRLVEAAMAVSRVWHRSLALPSGCPALYVKLVPDEQGQDSESGAVHDLQDGGSAGTELTVQPEVAKLLHALQLSGPKARRNCHHTSTHAHHWHLVQVGC
jgi:hypothetical protein